MSPKFQTSFQSWKRQPRFFKFFVLFLYIKRQQRNTQPKVLENIASWQHALLPSRLSLVSGATPANHLGPESMWSPVGVKGGIHPHFSALTGGALGIEHKYDMYKTHKKFKSYFICSRLPNMNNAMRTLFIWTLVKRKFHNFKFSGKIRSSILMIKFWGAVGSRGGPIIILTASLLSPPCLPLYRPLYSSVYPRVLPCIVPCIAVYHPCIAVYYHVLQCILLYFRVSCRVLPCVTLYRSDQCLLVYRDGKSPFPHRARVISFFNRLGFLLVSYQIQTALYWNHFMRKTQKLQYFLGFWAYFLFQASFRH